MKFSIPLKSIALSGTLLAIGVAAGAATSARLTLNGKTASNDVRVIAGSAYVKLTDVARALDMVVVKNGNGYEIKKAGGTGQVGNLNGKIGDVLFDGKWRLQVLEMQTPEAYTIKAPDVEPTTNAWDLIKWDRASQTMRATSGYHLVLLRCRVTNGQKTKQTLWTSPNDEAMHTALTDLNGGSHIPAAYDYAGAANQTKPLLPGEIINFALLFSVPNDTRTKDLIFSLKNNEYATKPTDVRVSLDPQ